MAGLEDPRRGLELQLDLGRRPGLERLRCDVTVAVGEVEHAAAHERGRAVREDVAQPRRQECHRVRRRHGHLKPRVTEELELIVERRPVVRQRARVVLSLIVRQPPRCLAGARDPRCGSDIAAHGDAIGRGALGPPDARAQALRGPGRLRAPLAAHLREIRCRLRRTAHEDRDRRFLVDAVPLVAEPAREPADELGHEVDVRPGDRRRGRHVAPRPDEHAPRARHRLVGAERDVRVAVGPPGDDHRRARDPVVVGPHGPVTPVRAVVLLLEPAQEPRLGSVDPTPPLLAPALAVDGRARAGGRCTRPCRSPSRRGRPPSGSRPCSGRRRCSGRPRRRSGRSRGAPAGAPWRPGGS